MPYHFDDWMVILQRWEPVISAFFPSQIPFWIEIQGLPLHYWKPKMLTDIGEGVGDLLDHELTPTAARIQVMVNGLEPLIKETIVEFDNGTEALVTLDYKRLKSHCTHCHRLTHAKKDCPGLQPRKDLSRELSPLQSHQNRGTNTTSHSFQKRGSRDSARSHYHPYKRPEKLNFDRTSESRAPRDYGSKFQSTPSERILVNKSYSMARVSPRKHDYYKGDSSRVIRAPVQNSEVPIRNAPAQSFQWREKTPVRENTLLETSQSSRNRRPPLERPVTEIPNLIDPPPIPTTEAVMGELCDVTIQYTSCIDPTESAARKQRVLQGETKGLMAQTATSIIESAKQAHLNNAAMLEIQQIRS